MAAAERQYGLIRLPKREKKVTASVPKPSIFGDESDEEGMAATNKQILLASQKNKTKRQTRMEMDKAMAEDPSVYEYDTLYDDMKREEEETAAQTINQTKTSEKQSRYVSGLLKASEKRKKEYERRAEKKVQKEREAEGEEFADKEKFVTSSYKSKMAEMQGLEDEERKREKLEEMMDATKQTDMSGFYRSLYKQTLGEGPDKPDTQAENKMEANAGLSDTNSEKSKLPKVSKRAYRPRPDTKSSDDEDLSKSTEHKTQSFSTSPLRRDSRATKHSSHHESTASTLQRDNRTTKHYSNHRSRSQDRQELVQLRLSERRQRSRSRDRKQRSRSRDRKQRSRSQDRKQRSRSQNRKSRSRTPVKKPENTKQKSEKKSVEERFAKRNDTAAVQSARERYLVRKAAKMGGR